jgi:molecular chaperone IbpA
MLLGYEDMTMRTTLDFSPLFRSGIGFDRVFDLLDNATRVGPADHWPPYDIVRNGDQAWTITMAVAGFRRDELELSHEPNLLVVSGSRAGEDHAHYLHRGIAARSFQRRFELADHVEVRGARLENGLLTIDLVREIPEEMKPRRIEIRQDVAGGETQRIDDRRQAA